MGKAMRVSTAVLGFVAALYLAALSGLAWLQAGPDRFAGMHVPVLAPSDHVRLAIGISAGVLAVLLLILTVAAAFPRRRRSSIEIRTAESGPVSIPAGDVALALAADISAAASVERATVRLGQEKNGIAVDVAMTVLPDAELPSVVDDVTARVESGLSRRYGATLSRRPSIRVRYAESRATAAAKAAGSGAAEPAASA